MKKQVTIFGKLLNPALEAYINKCVEFRYHGEDLKFYLSHELFSSYDIDDGTRLLLKTLARNMDFSGINHVWDAGCGTGVIGIALKKHHPRVSVLFTDRDHLALQFTEENCRLNGIKEYRVRGELGIELKIEDPKYDLIVSNIPAKMGSKAMEEFVIRCLSALGEKGICCLVIIKAHEAEIEQAIAKYAAQLVYKEGTERHTVFHFTGRREGQAAEKLLTPYIRRSKTFTLQGLKYKLDTVYNLPDFDTLGYQTINAAAAGRKYAMQGNCLFWNPGQGHFPVYCFLKDTGTIGKITLAGRDLLQLYTAQHNLLLNGLPAHKLELMHVSFLSGCWGAFDSLVIFPGISPVMSLYKELNADIKQCSAAEANILISAKSTFISRLQQELDCCRQTVKIKDKGYCAVLLAR